MNIKIAAALAATQRSPVPEAYSWLDGLTFQADRPLLNVSQAAPVAPPPEAMRKAMADAILKDPDVHLYGPVMGRDDLREAIAERWTASYGGGVAARQVAITSGCNEAFVAVMATIAGPGDEVMMPTPWYFNHRMWLDMAGVATIAIPTGDDMLPSIDDARALITPRTRAISLVTPNNPAGVEYPPELLKGFFDLAKEHGLTLLIDETYRDFLSFDGPPHHLFSEPDWDQTLVQLYSFSKAYRLTGHRVGAITAAAERLAQVEKFLDTVTICPTALGQIAALWGINNLDNWLAGERAEILSRRATIEAEFSQLAQHGWTLRSTGGYFAYMGYPGTDTSPNVARRILTEQSVLSLPAQMFVAPNDIEGARNLRIAFANINVEGIAELYHRLMKVAF